MEALSSTYEMPQPASETLGWTEPSPPGSNNHPVQQATYSLHTQGKWCSRDEQLLSELLAISSIDFLPVETVITIVWLSGARFNTKKYYTLVLILYQNKTAKEYVSLHPVAGQVCHAPSRSTEDGVIIRSHTCGAHARPGTIFPSLVCLHCHPNLSFTL